MLNKERTCVCVCVYLFGTVPILLVIMAEKLPRINTRGFEKDEKKNEKKRG